jgi:hypothetical protein
MTLSIRSHNISKEDYKTKLAAIIMQPFSECANLRSSNASQLFAEMQVIISVGCERHFIDRYFQ